jgi:hypothetical protein
MKTAEKVDSVREYLQARPGLVLLRWHGVGAEAAQLSRLENTSIIAMAMIDDAPVALRIFGTLERNDLGGQRLYFEGETLLRVRSGRRAGLVVKPERLDIDEVGVCAGQQKFLYAGDKSNLFSNGRTDMEFLDALVGMMRAPELPLPSVPVPRVYRMVRSVDRVKPRITGDLILRLSSMEGYRSDLSVADNFVNLSSNMCRKLAENSFLFPAELVAGGGLTMVDLSSVQDEVYHVPMETVDVSTEMLRTNILRSLKVRAEQWSAGIGDEEEAADGLLV